jgi:signal transduction histidine kinase
MAAETFELVLAAEEARPLDAEARQGLGREILIANALWFVRIRWFVVLALCAFGVACRVEPGFLSALRLTPAMHWPWALAAALALVNAAFHLTLRRIGASAGRAYVTAHLWSQIVIDLLILTALVHRVGSTATFIAFAYLFHIIMACIFFPPRSSFLVTVLGSGLFVACVGLETTGLLPSRSIVAVRMPQQDDPGLNVLLAASAVFTWFVVWYLASTISRAVRERDRQLAEANERLILADHEKNMIMLRTTHDLKAPFSGIESNIQLLRFVHWNELSEPVRHVISAIEARSSSLRARIRDILNLGELRSPSAADAALEPVDLDALLARTVDDLAERAAHGHITVRRAPIGATVRSRPSQLGTLFSNLIANAIVYSRDGGTVDIDGAAGPAGVEIRVADHGIGIAAEAMPRLFEEYFRTEEAGRHNPMSTGLGLAIVKQVARNLGLTVRVTSEKSKGTTFTVVIPV